MEHPYFRSVNFDDIYHKRVPPPFIPQLSSATDTSNFDQEFTREVPVLTPVHSGTFLLVCWERNGMADGSAYAGYARTVPRVQFRGGSGFDLTWPFCYTNSFSFCTFEGHDLTMFLSLLFVVGRRGSISTYISLHISPYFLVLFYRVKAGLELSSLHTLICFSFFLFVVVELVRVTVCYWTVVRVCVWVSVCVGDQVAQGGRQWERIFIDSCVSS